MNRSVAFAAGLALAAVVIPVRAAAPPYTRVDGRVRMSDGVAIDASLYLPASPVPMANGKVPLVVRQHGGGSNKDSPYDVGYGLAYVTSGSYALLTYSARGHGNSGGLFDYFGIRTSKDFSEMVDWVARVAGARVDTNDVGVEGYSQGGGESLLPAENDARVKAAAVGNTFDDLNHALNPNDCFKASFATGIFLLAYTVSASKTRDDLAVRWGAQLYTDSEDAGNGTVPSTTADLASRSPLSFVRPDPARPVYGNGLHIPVFWSNSWEDQLFPADHPQSILDDLRARGIPVHYWFASGGHAAGPNDPVDEKGKEAAMLDWMGEFLRGEDHGYRAGDADPRPLVDYAMRTAPGEPGTWVHGTAPSWPVPAQTASWFPAPEGRLAGSAPPAGAVGSIVNDDASANLAHDSITREVLARQVGGGIAGATGVDPGFGRVLDAVPESKNPVDTATYTGEPLAQGFTVVGAPVVTLPVTTTARTAAEIAAKVWDVAPDGSAELVWRGCRSFERPGSPARFVLSLWPDAHAFAPGHRVALTVSAVDFPTFEPDLEPSRTTLLAGARLDLPVSR